MDFMGPAVVLVWAAVTVVLALAIGRDTGDARLRVVTLAAAAAVLVAGNILVTTFSSVYYAKPLWLTAVLIAGWAGLFALIILLTRAVRQYRGKVFLLGVLLLVTLVCTTLILIVWPFGTPTALFFTRAQQIAEANGFAVLLPADEELDASAGIPVDALPTPAAGVYLNYERFLLQERAADAPMTEADLKALVAPGETPLGDVTVPADAEVSTVSVNGEPAVAATFEYSPPEAPFKPGVGGETVTILVLESGGVDVRFESRSDSSLTADELVEIASTLAPLE